MRCAHFSCDQRWIAPINPFRICHAALSFHFSPSCHVKITNWLHRTSGNKTLNRVGASSLLKFFHSEY
ncbi:hypothetical protein chiPu_0005048 [Chiloscyllium punctatum]|uniref:Uncharacterized protein n=1 Tax=Chiloscyllium punctatum TaxID=137246 RepID=A0A401S8G5_CHIPU|nr:hypothetical protein [Chiloscyllium punctatum]